LSLVPVHTSGNGEVDLQDRKQGQEEEEEEQSFEYPSLSPRSSNEFTQGHRVYDDTSPRASSDSKSLIVESDTSQDTVPSYPLSPSLSQTPSVTPASDDSTSFQTYPTRLSVASRSGDWDDRILNTDISPKRSSEPLSTWEKMKSTFTRTGSTSGRRSRTNSIRERRDHTDSSISRESGASLTSAKVDKGEPVAPPAQQPTPQPLMQSPSASASIVSLASHAQRGGASPIPTASTADLAKYQDAKLFPFPGMIQLEEQRNRAKGLPSVSASSPDIAMTAGGNDEEPNIPFPSSAGHTPPDMTRERKLSHQASDSRLVTRYNFPGPSPSQAEYLNVTPQPPAQNGSSLNLKLPMTLPGVKQWLSKNNKKKFSSPVFSPPSSTPSSPPAVDVRPLQAIKKQPSLTDLLRRKDSELGTDWEEINSTPTSASGDTIPGKRTSDSLTLVREGPAVNGVARSEQHADTEKTSKVKKLTPLADKNGNIQPYDEPLSPLPRPDLLSPPSSSLSIYPSHSTSGSSSTTSSQYSLRPLRTVGPQGALVLERLEENLARGSRSAIWASAIDDPARKLLLSSPVVQVVNANHVKDRFLLLFNDILIIAKPIIPDQDTFTETLKPNPLDRKFVVKSVVMLHQLRFHADRTDQPSKSSGYTVTRNPVIKSFVQNFANDPDHAVSSLFSKPRTADDPVALGQLLFRTLDLDRARLGEYLSKRSSKPVLKAYLDNFGFYGLRVDRALRVFLHSMAAPTRTAHHLEYFLDAFASRWYDANSSVVEYDKDTAHRLVRAIVQLNDLLHNGIAYEPGPTGYRQREVTSRDFLEAFRRYDPRCLVSDELLEDIYESMLREKLSQSRDTTSGSVADTTIVIKRPIPVRLTWKMQSEPIVLRIPHTDPHLTIRLYGQDLVFDPPFLTFAKSPEASFRVTGTSLGSKSLVMRRSGPNALNYAGLPLSTTVIVERAFMRHTFQMAFLNHNGAKRRYMFSVEDPLIRHQWALSLRRHVDQASASFKLSSTGSSKLQRAADRLAFRVLQETLIGMPPASAIHHPQRHKDPTRIGHNASDHSFSDPQPPHIRSKSRSKLYHRHGAGKHEPDISYGVAERDENLLSDDRDLQPRNEGPLWTARELELHCLHSSSIASVLSYLTPESGEHNSS
jgi:serine/arginine repetitive matrix protein 2